jgi:hypothetical protein
MEIKRIEIPQRPAKYRGLTITGSLSFKLPAGIKNSTDHLRNSSNTNGRFSTTMEMKGPTEKDKAIQNLQQNLKRKEIEIEKQRVMENQLRERVIYTIISKILKFNLTIIAGSK